MTSLADAPARLRILSDLDATMLVEAAAGTGKTALMAGRVTMLLARGAAPRAIAAITFTELAASTLAARVHRYIEELLAGAVPDPLRLALPGGLGDDQRRSLLAARVELDELTTATIHAFCQAIISSYAVEADIDPGACILDAAEADAAFDSVFEQWLKRRLNAPERAGDPLVTLSRDDPRRVVGMLKDLAGFRRKHRAARTPEADLGARPDIDFVDAVADFRRWISSQPVAPEALELVGELETLAGFYTGSFAPPPDFACLWTLAHPPPLACMRRDTKLPHGFHYSHLLTPKLKSDWVRAAGRVDGARLDAEANQCFERVDRCYRILRGRIAAALVAQLSAELDELLNEYAAFKRAAAVLDFDDLLERARALVCGHDDVRRALGERFRHILVDEFQDTDPTQSEILFRIAADDRPERWQDSMLRQGALFVVGDPKQAIYRFRGADIGSYAQARATIERQWPDGIVQITANFRSRPGILAHVNRCFADPLSGKGQPGYVALTPTLGAPDHDLPCAARITVDLPPDPRSEHIRDAEAEAVADVCVRLIGNLQVRGERGGLEPLTPGGIALLAPTGTELWRYERALEQRGLPIASHAGKSLFRRQEVQDLLALARVLADPRDSLAFGALMRGPLIGLADEELLDITAALPRNPDHLDAAPYFTVLTDPRQVAHPLARHLLSILQDLRRHARATTPALLLAEALERLAVRPLLAARERDRSDRATANIEAFLERARPYGARGLKAFVRDLTAAWRDGAPHDEGRPDRESDAIEVISIHSAKGLEWPVVIPINTSTLLRSREPFVYRAADETLHWLIGDIAPPELLQALGGEEDSVARERERVWYVACTRARELLVVPELPQAQSRSWARIVNLAHGDLPLLDLSHLPPRARDAEPDTINEQTSAIFAEEREAIAAASTPVPWLRPSDHDPDRASAGETVAIEFGDAPEKDAPVGVGRVRGLLLHKLMEEALTGELPEDVQAFAARTRVLMGELVTDAEGADQLPDADEVAATAWRTLWLPEIAALRSTLIPEWPVYALLPDRADPTALSGRIDAIAFDGDRPSVVLDWKSDVAPTEHEMREHARQLGDYLTVTGATRGAVVYMTPGVVRWTRAPM